MELDPVLSEFAARHPAAQRLAELACLAVRVEPHFLRALRQRFLRDSHPGAELELWHGPLAAGPGADGFTFEPEVLHGLRRKLGDEPIEIKTAVLALTLHSHRHHPELARLEAALNALPVIDPDVADAVIEAVLKPALDQLRAGGEAALRVARWLLHAAPRLHPRVLRVGAAWLALLQASAQLGGRRLLEQAPPADIDLAGPALTHPLPPVGTRSVGVLLANGWLQFRSPLLAGARITVPAIAPSMVTVASDAGRNWSVEAAPGVSLDVNGAAALTVLTLTGDRFRLEATRRLRAGEGMVVGRSAPLLMRVWARTAQTISYEFTDRDDPGDPDGPGVSERRGTFVRAEVGRAALLRELVASASNDAGSGAQICRTLYHLLIPKEIEYLLGGNSETGLDVDRTTAGLPWELLDTERVEVGGLTRPWAIRSKLLRVMRRTPTPTAEPAAVTKEDRALVIGEPPCDASRYPPLPGARAEARAVVAQLGAGTGRLAADHVRALIGADGDADGVIHALFEHPYRIVHIAGHGGFDASEGDVRAGGVVLSCQGTRLGANEVGAMRAVPDLVFMNCCHQPAPDATPAVPAYDRAAFAASVAEALIQVGVRCVIVAGWAVEAEPAAQFAGTFYEALLSGERFVDAVAAAREAAWRLRPEGNTWGAYQCYGDAQWRWHRDTGSDADDAGPGGAMAAPMELVQALEDLAVRARARAVDRPRLGRRVRALEQRYGPVWGAGGAVAQAFGVAFGAAADDDRAVFWYQAALRADDGSMTFRAVEQLAHHLTCRLARQNSVTGQRDIAAAIDQLHKLVAIQRTAERENLLGRAYKGKAMNEARSGRATGAAEALQQTIEHFGAALSLAGTTRPAWAFEAGKSLLVAELRLAMLHKRRPTVAPGRSIEALRALMGPDRADPDLDLATAVDRFELRWLEGVATGTLAHAAPDLVAGLRELAAGASAAPLWAPALAEARFVLEPYLTLADAAERAAAKEVLSCLAGLAAK